MTTVGIRLLKGTQNEDMLFHSSKTSHRCDDCGKAFAERKPGMKTCYFAQARGPIDVTTVGRRLLKGTQNEDMLFH